MSHDNAMLHVTNIARGYIHTYKGLHPRTDLCHSLRANLTSPTSDTRIAACLSKARTYRLSDSQKAIVVCIGAFGYSPVDWLQNRIKNT